MDQSTLISELESILQENLAHAQALKELPLDTLRYKATPSSWSALECIEHLNRYADFYLPAIRTAQKNARKNSTGVFSPGVLGNYFAKLMRTGQKMKKMKSPKEMNPSNSMLLPVVVDTFIANEQALLEMLQAARLVDLKRAKTPISLSKLIRLRLGDTYRFLIYHEQRHMQQALRAAKLK